MDDYRNKFLHLLGLLCVELANIQDCLSGAKETERNKDYLTGGEHTIRKILLAFESLEKEGKKNDDNT